MCVLRPLIWVMVINVCSLVHCPAVVAERAPKYGAWEVAVVVDEMDDRISCVLRTRSEQGATLTLRATFDRMEWYVEHPGKVGMKRLEVGSREAKMSKRERAWRKLTGKGPKMVGYSYTKRYVRFRFDDEPAYERGIGLWRGRMRGITVWESEVSAAKAGRVPRIESGRVYRFSLSGFSKAFDEAIKAGCVSVDW